MLERSRSRRMAMQILYQREITGESVSCILGTESYSVEEGVPDDFCRSLVLGVESHLPHIDDIIGTVSENWSVSRMPLVDRSILRLATYEVLFAEDAPASVAINEAVELAKVFGGEDSSKFVNGVLGKIAERHAAEDVKETADE